MTVPAKGTPFSDVIGFEGIKHGTLPNVVNSLGRIGYDLQASQASPKVQEQAATPAPSQTFTLDF